MNGELAGAAGAAAYAAGLHNMSPQMSAAAAAAVAAYGRSPMVSGKDYFDKVTFHICFVPKNEESLCKISAHHKQFTACKMFIFVFLYITNCLY